MISTSRSPSLGHDRGDSRSPLPSYWQFPTTTFVALPSQACFVEINNENGLIHAWLGGQVDGLPEVFRRELQRQWNDWLRQRHSSTVGLRLAWEVRQEPLGAERLVNAGYKAGIGPWVEQGDDDQQQARGRRRITDRDYAAGDQPGVARAELGSVDDEVGG